MYTGSMHGAGADVFCVWGYVISHAQAGTIELNPIHLAPILGMTELAVAAAIAKLCESDPNSRSQQHDGRRLVPEGRFAYHVPTHDTYRALRTADDRREYMRGYMADYRKDNPVNSPRKQSTRRVNTLADTEAVTDTEAKAVTTTTGRTPPVWLTPICDVYERHYGAGSFPHGLAGKTLKPLHVAGHSGEEIAERLNRYIERLDDVRYFSLPKFRQTFDAYTNGAVQKASAKKSGGVGQRTYNEARKALGLTDD